MNVQSEQLLRAIGELDETLVLDAAPPDVPPKKRVHRLQWAGLAACVCAAAAAVFAFGPAEQPGPGGGAAVPTGEPSPAVTDEPPAPSQPGSVHVDMDEITANLIIIPGRNSPDNEPYDPELYDIAVHWDKEALSRYYGRPLAPSYIPEGLVPLNEDQSASVTIRKADGAVVWDTVCLNYCQPFGVWEDGSTRFADYESGVWHGFELEISRVVPLACRRYDYDAAKQSDIAGVPVTIGYCSVPYTLVGPDTDGPTGYTDLYVAEFTLDGIQFRITASELELTEVVKVAASIICPESEIVVEP